jgi:hypothetical protein
MIGMALSAVRVLEVSSMEMQVIGVTDDGRLCDSDFTVAVFRVIDSQRVVAFTAIDADERRGLQARFPSEFRSFLLVSDAGLAELRKRDSAIDTLGQCNSADITRRQIVAPADDQER